MKRACLVAGCAGFAVANGRGRCEAHRRTTSQRGYGPDHRRARSELALTLPRPCVYCERIVRPGDDWVAAHWTDRDDTSPRVVAHALCNQRAKDDQLAPRLAVI